MYSWPSQACHCECGIGTGSEEMQRIATPLIGGTVSAPLLSLLVVPVAYRLMRRPRRAVESTPVDLRS